MLDHLVFAAPKLADGVEYVADVLGVAPSPGGQHLHWGTANALLALGESSYLEVIGPAPDLPAPKGGRPFRVDELTAPALVTWAAKSSNIESQVRRAKERGYDPGPVHPGARTRPDGVKLAWKLTMPRPEAGDGLVPFLIEWGGTEHPAKSAATGCSLVSMHGEHPNPDGVRSMLDALGLELGVHRSDAPALAAVIESPRGSVTLR